MSTYFAADLVSDDVGRKTASNGSAWPAPDVAVRAISKGSAQAGLELEMRGFGYYNTRTGEIVDDRGIESLKIIPTP